MGFVIVYKRNNHRVRKDGELTPYFEYAAGAQAFIDRRLRGSKYLTIKQVNRRHGR